MQTKNVAYTEEYQKHRKSFEYIFNEKYKSDIERREFLNGKLTLETTFYSDSSGEVTEYNMFASKTEVFDFNINKVSEFTNINHSTDFFTLVEHSNGKNYLFFSTDLYGYSIMDLSDYSINHFIPEESFIDHQETFIWTQVLYCKSNNIIAVDGCYWACPTSIEFYNFSNPDGFPLEKIYSSYDMEDELNIDVDVTPVRWNDDGTFVLRCCDKDDSDNEYEKTIDILSRKK